ncbi:glycosyltransferase [Microbacterium aoyamense]|nr:nucleotide disphospho-sugar-binding domain-containing protein [Microbacterium aoyamense]
MARFLLSAMPFTGHVNPMRAVAAALTARGHSVRFYTGSAFRAAVEASGAAFIPWTSAPDFDENDLAATFPRLVGKKGFRQLLTNVVDVFIETIPAQVDDLLAEWDREPWDAVVSDELSLGASFTAQKLDTAWGTVAVVPLNLASSQGAPSTTGISRGTNPITKTRDALLRALVPALSGPITGPLRRARAAIGLPYSNLTLDRMGFSPQLIVASGSPMLDYDRTDRPEHLHFVGELALQSKPTTLPPWWGDLDGRTVVHVAQGTQNIDPTDLIGPAVEALAEEDVLVVVATGIAGRDELPFPIPANARVGGFLPYAELLPRTDIMITNGGWGGTLAALGHGIPLVIGGGDLDKPEVAARVAWSGAGVNLRTGTPSTAQVARGYSRVASDASYRDAAARVGEQLRSLGGTSRAAELLEGLLVKAL